MIFKFFTPTSTFFVSRTAVTVVLVLKLYCRISELFGFFSVVSALYYRQNNDNLEKAWYDKPSLNGNDGEYYYFELLYSDL